MVLNLIINYNITERKMEKSSGVWIKIKIGSAGWLHTPRLPYHQSITIMKINESCKIP